MTFASKDPFTNSKSFYQLAGPGRARMAPADDGGRELGADLQVDEAAAPREAQRPPLHLPPQVREGAQIKLQLDLPCLKRIKVHVHFSERCQRKSK